PGPEPKPSCPHGSEPAVGTIIRGLVLVKWSGLIRPPQLQDTDTDSGDERTATWLELFFDLAFVLVVAELAVGLRDDRTLHGVLVVAGLFSSGCCAWGAF